MRENDIKHTCSIYTEELYQLITKNYHFFNTLYKIINEKYVEKTPINNLETHIIFISFVIALVRELSIDERVTLQIARYKIYNTFSTQFKLFTLIFDNQYASFNLDGEFFRIMHRFSATGLIKKHNVRINQKTEIFYHIDFIGSIMYQKFIYSHHPYTTFIKEGVPYLCTFSIYSIRKLIKYNVYSDLKSDINLVGLNTLNTTKIKFDQILLDKAFKVFTKYYKGSYNDVYDNIQQITKQYKIELNAQQSTAYNLNHEIDDLDFDINDESLREYVNTNFKKKLKSEEQFKTTKSNLSKLLSIEFEKLEFFKFYALAKTLNSEFFYLPHHADFRGRMYSVSQLSPIIAKYIRYIMTYEAYSEQEIVELEIKTLNTKAYLLISKFFYKLKVLNISNERPIVLVTIIFLLIELAKKHKITLMSTVTFSVTLEKFIDCGLNLYLTKEAKFDKFEEELEYEKILYHLQQLITNNIKDNFIISKDSTASVLQHLFK